MDKHTLDDLIIRCKQNDEKSFRKIVEEYQYMIYSLSFRLLCNEEDAHDIVQETFIKIWLNVTSFDTDKKFSTWIYKIATNLCLDKLKSNSKKILSENTDYYLNEIISSENIEQKIIDNELGSIISALTNSLTPKQRIVFTLTDLEGLEVNEIVQITGLTANEIKSNLFLARKTIRKLLEKY